MNWLPVSKKTFFLLGLSRTGLSTARWLLKQGARVLGYDDTEAARYAAQSLGVVLTDRPHWEDVSALVQSPGIPFHKPSPHPLHEAARDYGVPIITDCDLFRAAFPEATVVGVTGTNGKSTTASLIHHVLKTAGVDCSLGGNIGIPVLDLPKSKVYVLELSSYQLALSHPLKLDWAVWLNLTPDHLERHGSMEHYSASKERIFLGLKQKAFVGVEDRISKNILEKHHDVAIPLSLPNSISFERAQLKGAHNEQNMSAAYSVALAMGVESQQALNAIESFKGLRHRQEHTGSVDSVVFINDSKATNEESTEKALNTYEDIYWIVGGQAKSQGLDALRGCMGKVKKAYLIGSSMDSFSKTLDDMGVPYVCSEVLEKAMLQAFNDSKRSGGGVVLLSPAAASWDQYPHFEARGDAFCRYAKALCDGGVTHVL